MRSSTTGRLVRLAVATSSSNQDASLRSTHRVALRRQRRLTPMAWPRAQDLSIIYGHSDAALTHPEAPDLLGPFLQQGIPTQVIGNCGLGVSPAPMAHRDALTAFMALIIPRGTKLAWESFAKYLHCLETVGPPLNVATLATHGAIRCAVKGAEPGVARDNKLAAMSALVQEALDAGAFGLSAGLIYPPGMWADTDEIVALCAPVADVDGLFGCHVRGSSELAVEAERELLEIGRRTGVRLQHSHHETFGPGHWHLTLETIRRDETASTWPLM